MSLSPKIVGTGAISLAIVGFLALMAFGLLNSAPVTSMRCFTRIRRPAPAFTLHSLDGDELDLSQYY